MNYGLLNFKAQNGKPGIFWTNEQSRTTTKKNFGYKKRDQKFPLRNYPNNYDRLEPLGDNKHDEEEKPKKPAKNFIQRNRERIVQKGKKDNFENPNGTVTLTQEQLNAILASVGKVASGKEDNLRISFDSDSKAITIESPRGHHHNDSEGENEKHDRDRYEKESKDRKPKQKGKKKKEKEEFSIYDLLGEDKSSRSDKVTRRKKDSGEKRNRYDSDNHRDESEERRTRHREDSEDRIKHSTRYSDKHSHERHHSRQRDYSRERDRHYSPPPSEDRPRRHRNDSERRSRESREADDHRKKERNRGHDKKKSRDRDYDEDQNRESDREEKENKSDNKKDKAQNFLSPREVLGLPNTLPMRHMTVAERRRLMIARETAAAEQEKKEEELTKEYWKKAKKDMADSQRKKKERKEERSPRRRERSREQSRERSAERSTRRRDKSRDRSRERSTERHSRHRDTSRDHSREVSRERSRDRRDASYERSHDRARHRRQRSRTPSPDDRKDDRSITDSLPPPAPKPLSLAEKKRLQWERERVESKLENQYTPWGKPGAGAPPQNKTADYRGRQFENQHSPIDEELDSSHNKTSRKNDEDDSQHHHSNQSKVDQSKNYKDEHNYVKMQSTVPAAMRSSFIFGQYAPDADMYQNTKEEERKQWLLELEKQKEEKRLRQMKEMEKQSSQNTWADKFSNDYKPAGLPDQVPDIIHKDTHMDTGRVSSAPVNADTARDEDTTYIRGQNVFIDPITKKELEDKRQRQMEHQRAIMQQVEEKQRLKQQERDKKLREELEEEQKIQAERDRLQKQFESEQNKTKMKEAKRQEEVERLKAAMDEAHERAMREKYSRRMQHLEQGGHDISHLKANLAVLLKDDETVRAKITPRDTAVHVQPTYVPGLNLEMSPRAGAPVIGQLSHKETYHEPYTENRILTPSQFRRLHDHEPKREFGTQTGMKPKDHSQRDGDEFVNGNEEGTRREPTEVSIMYKFVNGKRVRVKSAPKEERYQKPEVLKKRKPEKATGKKKWNYQNKTMVKPRKQSEKDPFFEKKNVESKIRRQKREQELLQLVEINKNLIPTERTNRTPGHSRDPSPHSDVGRSPRNIDRTPANRRSKSYSPDHLNESRSQTRTLDAQNSPALRSRSPGTHRSLSPPLQSYRSRSPPVPAIKHRYQSSDRPGGAEILQLDYGPKTKISYQKYGDVDPLEIPVGNGDFVPFTRTVDILDPAEASFPMPMSREATKVADARKAYIKGMKPGSYGRKLDTYEDRIRMPNEPKDMNPITNPSLVKDHPTQRQDIILQQLSTLKENLMQRQRELETFSPTDLE